MHLHVTPQVPLFHNHGYWTVDPLKRVIVLDILRDWCHNHGYWTVDPLKLNHSGALQWNRCVHNHGYWTVDPLKRPQSAVGISPGSRITTVIGPWTH